LERGIVFIGPSNIHLMLSVAHTEEDIDRLVAECRSFARSVKSGGKE
jgi:glutamate-1-semialdehyde aminotransferase